MTPTDDEIIAAVAWCYENKFKNVTPLAVWHRLYDEGQTDTTTLQYVYKRLQKIARERRISRHKTQDWPSNRWRTAYRPLGTDRPMFSRPF